MAAIATGYEPRALPRTPAVALSTTMSEARDTTISFEALKLPHALPDDPASATAEAVNEFNQAWARYEARFADH